MFGTFHLYISLFNSSSFGSKFCTFLKHLAPSTYDIFVQLFEICKHGFYEYCLYRKKDFHMIFLPSHNHQHVTPGYFGSLAACLHWMGSLEAGLFMILRPDPGPAGPFLFSCWTGILDL